jgi:hypothetical protein
MRFSIIEGNIIIIICTCIYKYLIYGHLTFLEQLKASQAYNKIVAAKTSSIQVEQVTMTTTPTLEPSSVPLNDDEIIPSHAFSSTNLISPKESEKNNITKIIESTKLF